MTLKDFYDSTTRSGAQWAYSSDDGDIVIGEVLQDGKWIGQTWIRDSKENLFCQGPRAYDIQRRYPIEIIEVKVRNLDTPFVIDVNRKARVNYTVRLKTDLALSGTSSASVKLVVNDQPVQTVANILVATLAILTSYSPEQYQVLSGIVPAGATVNLQSELSGSGVAELVSIQETLL